MNSLKKFSEDLMQLETNHSQLTFAYFDTECALRTAKNRMKFQKKYYSDYYVKRDEYDVVVKEVNALKKRYEAIKIKPNLPDEDKNMTKLKEILNKKLKENAEIKLQLIGYDELKMKFETLSKTKIKNIDEYYKLRYETTKIILQVKELRSIKYKYDTLKDMYQHISKEYSTLKNKMLTKTTITDETAPPTSSVSSPSASSPATASSSSTNTSKTTMGFFKSIFTK
ncbi:hypothetical protein FQA39_LY15011 [Lamprigera yunnana]|nr:hypothetical protein FQA39_LY15011 [Lamprigera yunnana]